MDPRESRDGVEDVAAYFGADVFDAVAMQRYLSARVFAAVQATRTRGERLDANVVEEVASAMKIWAMEKGATHFTHWFQPLTGATAEKHDAFLSVDADGGVIAEFSGKDLVQGETDGSSFPSGGLRATFEARGYTAWDPTSHAFVRNARTDRAVLCIPCVFCGYRGEALDEKTPLLRSQTALIRQLRRVARLFEIEGDLRPYATLGIEQEYFLVDKRFYDRRPDLMLCGRTLFGRRPARHQQMEDHYYGSIKPRILRFMGAVDRALWRLGVPAKTRHNEVSPGQFEIAPVFGEQNLSVDQNMIIMQTLQETAEAHGLACLLHEKPYKGVNGSGKHNNWSIVGPDGRNWFAPGATPHENAKFLFMLVAVMKAIDTYAPLIRATVATAGNDHRLGAAEAPPAIMSISLGDQLADLIGQIEAGTLTSSKKSGHLETGVATLPRLPRDVSDRNRTSPFAFTGNKFEFRAVGASQSCAGPNTVLNTSLAWALDEMTTAMEAALPNPRAPHEAGGHTAEFHDVLGAILQKEVREHGRIVFDGDGYSDEWKAEAARRGLPDLADAPAALERLADPAAVELYGRYKVLSEREALSRLEVQRHAWAERVRMEGECALNLARVTILPAALRWERELAESVREAKTLGRSEQRRREHYDKLADETERLYDAISVMDAMLAAGITDVRQPLDALRESVDALEALVPDSLWPLPSYRDLFFRL